jgi:hypothetical protein
MTTVQIEWLSVGLHDDFWTGSLYTTELLLLFVISGVGLSRAVG